MLTPYLDSLLNGNPLNRQQAAGAMGVLLRGEASQAQAAAFLVSLRLADSETSAVIAGCVEAMRTHSRKINAPEGAVDMCGTGGAPFKTFNIRSISSFVVSGAGVPVAKHGNRSNSSPCGSADLFEALGVNLGATPEQSERALNEVGICFMFAPGFHPAMKHVVPIRKELKVRTVFNLIGPLTNPADVQHQLLGVAAPNWVETHISALKDLGSTGAIVVHSEMGADEITLLGNTTFARLVDDEITTRQISAVDFGLEPVTEADLANYDPTGSAKLAMKILNGGDLRGGPSRIVLANSAAGLLAAGKVGDLKEGVALARESITSGAAVEKLEALKRITAAPEAS